MIPLEFKVPIQKESSNNTGSKHYKNNHEITDLGCSTVTRTIPELITNLFSLGAIDDDLIRI